MCKKFDKVKLFKKIVNGKESKLKTDIFKSLLDDFKQFILFNKIIDKEYKLNIDVIEGEIKNNKIIFILKSDNDELIKDKYDRKIFSFKNVEYKTRIDIKDSFLNIKFIKN